MSNSSMIACTVKSPNHSGKRAYKVTRITPHCMVGRMTAQDCGGLFARSSYQASSNYGIGKDGEIGLYVDEQNRSWCSSSADNDNRAITIECASGTRAPYIIDKAVWESLIELCIDICRRYGKKKLLWLGDKQTSLHYRPADDEMVLTAHRWFAAKSCPGDYMYNRLGALADAVTAVLSKTEVKKEEQEAPNTAAASLIRNEEGDREKRIWGYFEKKNINHAAIAGLMGNLYAESALRPNNLQNSFERKLDMTDKGYTAAVNDGSYTNFAHDGAGYGLAQWTWHTRKQALLAFARKEGKSIDDLQMQLDFLWQELQGYPRSMAALLAGKSIRAVSDVILTDFEKPADQSSRVKEKRASLGKEIYDRQTRTEEKKETGRYTLQFGAFSQKGNAANRAKALAARGIETEVQRAGSFWKVWLKKRGTVDDMAEERKAMEANKIKTVIVEV